MTHAQFGRSIEPNETRLTKRLQDPIVDRLDDA
jgi:hypothetical protein